MSTSYVANFSPLDNLEVVIPIELATLTEIQGVGWLGIGEVDASARALSTSAALRTALDVKLVPGKAVELSLAVGGDSASSGTIARKWPSVITSVSALPWGEYGPDDSRCEIHFCDTLTFLRDRPIWGVFSELFAGRNIGRCDFSCYGR